MAPITDQTEIDELEMNLRPLNCMRAAGLRWVWQLRRVPDNILLRIPNLGKVTLCELREHVPFDLRGEEPLTDDWIWHREQAARPGFRSPVDWVAVIAGAQSDG